MLTLTKIALLLEDYIQLQRHQHVVPEPRACPPSAASASSAQCFSIASVSSGRAAQRLRVAPCAPDALSPRVPQGGPDAGWYSESS
jgi:hypothetical protein